MQRVRKLVGGSLDGPPPHCVTSLLLWPTRWEMDCPPLVRGQHCSGGSISAPHSSLHYSFCNQAEKRQSLLTLPKVKTVCIPFSWKVLHGSRKFSTLLQDQAREKKKKKRTRPGHWVCVRVCGRAAGLPVRSKQKPWMTCGEEWPAYSKKKGIYGLE